MITRQREARPAAEPGQALTATARYRALARRHWAFGVVLAAGLALRVAALVAYQPALVYLDSARYLGADQRGLDPLGYSYLLLRPVLLAGAGTAGWAAAVAAVQHALGLAMAVCLYLLATRLGAARWLAVLAAAPVLLDAYQVQAEQMIMPDVLFEALIVAAVTVLLWRPDPGLARLAGAAALLGVSATVRQVGEVLALPLLGYALAWRRGTGSSAAIRAAVAARRFRTAGRGVHGAVRGRPRDWLPAVKHGRRLPVRQDGTRRGLRDAAPPRLRAAAVPVA